MNTKSLFNQIKKSFTQAAESIANETPAKTDKKEYRFTEDDPGYVSFPVDVLVDVSKKLLDLNRGVVEADHRDALYFRKAYTVPELLKERIQLDPGQTARNFVRKSTYRKQLSGLSQNVFQDYIDGLLIGNPLSMPLEEINPMHIVDQSRRFTQLGPGGIASPELITEESQNVNPSEFFFLDTIAGPESSPGDVMVLTSNGWRQWREVSSNDKLACNVQGVLTFQHPKNLCIHKFTGDLITIKNKDIVMRVTPNHRVVYSETPDYSFSDFKIGLAKDLYGKKIYIPRFHETHIWVDNISDEDLNLQIKKAELIAILTSFFHESSIDTITIKIPSTIYSNHIDIVTKAIRGLTITSTESTQSGILLSFKRGAEDLLMSIDYFYSKISGDIRPSFFDLSSPAKERFAYVYLLMNNFDYFENFFLSTHVKKKNIVTVFQMLGLYPKDKQLTMCGSKDWGIESYDDLVYSAHVPGSLVYLRGTETSEPYWSGNSEKIGVDTRVAWNTKLGSDGQLYQKFYDRKLKKYVWLNPYQVSDKNIKFPD